MTLTEITQHFDNVKEVGRGQYAANCPACSDSNRHLYIAESEGKILLDCKHGCSFNDIAQASRIPKKEFFPPKPKPQPWVFIREHIYTDESGAPIAKKAIYDKGGGSKTAVWYRFDDGSYIKGLNGLKMPPYHVHNLKEGNTVIIAEGEKDVETLERMGYRASCSPNGAGGRTSWIAAHNKYFNGKAVIILTDNDDAGREHGRATAESLCGAAESVRLIPSESIYPQLKEKGDISDIVQEIGLDKAKELLTETVKAVEVYSKSEPLFPEPKHTKAERQSYIAKKCLTPEKKVLERLCSLDPQHYHFSDRGSSELFADMFRHELRYNTTAKEWYYYTGKVWRIDGGGMVVHSKAKKLFDALMIYAVSIEDEQQQKAFREYYGKFGSKNKRDTLVKDAADCCYISSEELDDKPIQQAAKDNEIEPLRPIMVSQGTLDDITDDLMTETEAPTEETVIPIIYDEPNAEETVTVTASDTLPDDVRQSLIDSAQSLNSAYPDALGWLYIPNTAISYPVMQSGDNDFYLSHAYDGSRLQAGSVFLDYRCEGHFLNNINIVYGHNMKNGSMFAGVLNFTNDSYFDSHRYGWLATRETVYRIDFFSCARADWHDSLYDGAMSVAEWVPHICDKSVVSREMTYSDDDRFISLSTCSYEFQNARTILTGKLVETIGG